MKKGRNLIRRNVFITDNCLIFRFVTAGQSVVGQLADGEHGDNGRFVVNIGNRWSFGQCKSV